MSADAHEKLEKLRTRYYVEREKRLRAEGNDQYVGLEQINQDLDKDPFADPNFTRDPIIAETEVAVIGAGLSGLMTGVRLMQAGISNIRIIDKACDFGGTWYWNRYPGAACDVESYIYMPFLEETGYIPSEKYAKAPEIFEHCQRIARHYDLYDRAIFQTLVSELRWDDAKNHWIVSTNRGDRLAAKFIAIAGGVMHKAKLPGIEDVERFKGRAFHTTRWDYAYTGGGPTIPMDKLKDKKVAIIGTGATAIQAVPRLAEAAEHLYVVQRTPSAVGPRGNRPTDPEWAATLQPGWQYQRMVNFNDIVSSNAVDVDMVDDGWTEIFRNIPQAYSVTTEEQQIADMEQMDKIRARVESIVTDPGTADSLKPWYNMMCKRPCFHDEYLQSFNRDNVSLIDTQGRGVDRITEKGLVFDGKEYEVDCIIYASGFEISTFYVRRLGFEIYGREGRSLTEDWGAPTGPHTLHGIFTRGFPNMMMFSTIQGGYSVNFLHMLSELAKHVASVIKSCHDQGIDVIEPTAKAEEEWWQEILKYLMASAQFRAQCTPGYMNAEGKADMSLIKISNYNGGLDQYVDILRQWREQGDFPGLEAHSTVEA